MTEDEARARIGMDFGAAAAERIASFLTLLTAENERQNLIAPSTMDQLWVRHVLDSAQLVGLGRQGLWIDIGTGGGFPGIVAALLRPGPMLLVEPRRRRSAFLEHCVEALSLATVRVLPCKIEEVRERAATVSARAVASVENLLHMAAGCATTETRWLLPRGRFSQADLVALRGRWRGMFHVEQSLTHPESSILVLDGVSRR